VESQAVSARAAVLSRLRDAQRTARLPEAETAPPALDGPRPPEECLERFRQELAALGVENHLEPTAEGVRARVKTLIDGLRVLSWDRDLLPYDLAPLLTGAAFGMSPRETQAAAEVGLTGCDGAIAETGTLALLSGKGRSRAVSLLPPVHVAVIRRADIVFGMAEYFRGRANGIAESAALTFVTGPSRTADIELTLTLGVHGPGKVIVVIGP
jgi:L-lactate dehydrogenase complex protein LldG